MTVLRFMYHLLKKMTIFEKKIDSEEIDIYVYAETINQAAALDTTVTHLRNRGQKLTGTAPKSIIFGATRESVYRPFKITMNDFVRTIALAVIRARYVNQIIKSKYSDKKDWCLIQFLLSYPYLVYFYRKMHEVKPKFVLVSNDHNVSNRALLAVARFLAIKTVYLQHASVSKLFPALNFDYAFLDGQHALDTYRACRNNVSDKEKPALEAMVVLSGQKKPLHDSQRSKDQVVGIAIKNGDDTKKVKQLIDQLEKKDFNVVLRWHPLQKKEEVQSFQEYFKYSNRVNLSDPSRDAVREFLRNVKFLIAGNSSIHLEAALCAVSPIFLDFSNSHISDYYGYVKFGISKAVDNEKDLIALLSTGQFDWHPDVEAVRYYSATYRTKWEGKEGQLVAEYLVHMKDKAVPRGDVLLPN